MKSNPKPGAGEPAADEQTAVVPQGEAAPSPESDIETGEVRTETRTVYAMNRKSTLLTLEDGTPFPRGSRKWLTPDEAARFSRFDNITVLS